MASRDNMIDTQATGTFYALPLINTETTSINLGLSTIGDPEAFTTRQDAVEWAKQQGYPCLILVAVSRVQLQRVEEEL